MEGEIEKQIISCIEEAMQGKGFSEMKVDLTGTNEKGEGYIADFTFATVTGTDNDDEFRELHLAIKVGKKSKQLIESLPVLLEYYRRETFFYNTVFPTFRKFQLDKNIKNPFDAIPMCHKAFVSNTMEALVLENLKQKGYALHDKKKPMNLTHIKLVLKNYAKLHALSFALRDQKEDEFNRMTADYDSIIGKIIPLLGLSTRDSEVPPELREAGRNDLAEKYEELIEKGKNMVILGILSDVPPDTVITHGDCHNNNFLFEYQNDDNDNPLSVAIIDWQISELHSPVMDLSFFIYCGSSRESLAQLDLLLRFYHSHLTEFLRELGSDPEKLFPYSKLVEHWTKYSPFSFLMTTGLLQLLFADKENTPSIEKLKDEGTLGRIRDGIKMEHREAYRYRLTSIVDHFFSFKLT